MHIGANNRCSYRKNECPYCRAEAPQLIDLFPETCKYRQTAINAAFEKYADALNTLKQSAEQCGPTTVDADHTINGFLSALDDQNYLPAQTVTDCTGNLLNIHASITELKNTVRKNKKAKENLVEGTCFLKEKLRSAARKNKKLKICIVRKCKEIAILKQKISKAKRSKAIYVISDSN